MKPGKNNKRNCHSERSKSMMVASKQHLQLQREQQNKAADKRRVFEVALLMQVKGRWAGRAPGQRADCLTDFPFSCSGCALHYFLNLSLSLVYIVCLLSVRLHTHLIHYPLAHPPSCILTLSFPGPTWSAFLSLCISVVGMRGESGEGGRQGVWVKGSQGTHHSACLWSLH